MLTYAGFWKRAAAYLIDSIALSFVIEILWVIVGSIAGLPLMSLNNSSSDTQAFSALGEFVMVFVIFELIAVVGVWLYFALFESSRFQATPGKMALGIVVTDMEGNRIGFGRATGRYFGKIISQIIFYVGYMMAGWTHQKRALHDMMAGTLVVNDRRR